MLFSWKSKRTAPAGDLAGSHVAVFLMNHAGAVTAVRPVLESLRAAGARVTLVNYSCSAPFPYDELRGLDVTYLTLSDQGMESIPRLSRAQYLEQCGDDIDFPRVYFNESLCAGLRTERAWLFEDSFHHQRYYGTAWRIEQTLAALATDYSIVHQGSEPVSKIVYAKCRKRGLPTLLWETSFFPDKLLVDSRGMHFFSGENKVEHDWPGVKMTPLDEVAQRRIDRYLEQWRGGRISKYPQTTDDAEWSGLQNAIRPDKKTLFVVGQVPWDANILNGLHTFDGYADMLAHVRENLPPGWQAVYKPHPVAPEALAEFAVPGESFHVVRRVSIHDLVKRSDAVFVHSSNVGLEALIYDKPVVVCGRPFYANRGLTLDLTDRGDFATLLDRAVTFKPERPLRDRLLNYIAFSYLIDCGDTAALAARLRDAASVAQAAGPIAARQAPFSANMPIPALWYVGLQESYNALARENYGHREILERIATTTNQLPWGVPLEAPEDAGADGRPLTLRMCEIPPELSQPYLLAARLVGGASRILDLGCGTGYGSHLLAAEVDAEVTAVDVAPSAICFAQNHWSHERVEHVCASAGAYEFEESSYDAAVAFGVLESIADDRRLVERLWASLRPGGRLVLSVANVVREPLSAHPRRVRHYTARELEKLVEGLPNVDDRHILALDGPPWRCVIRAGAKGRQLILVAEKAPRDGDRSLAEDLAALLPFDDLPRLDMSAARHRFAAAEMTAEASELDEMGGLEFVRADTARREPVCLAQGPVLPLAAGSYELLIEMTCPRGVAEDAVSLRLSIGGAESAIQADAIQQTPQGLLVRLKLDSATGSFLPAVDSAGAGPLRILGWRIARVPELPTKVAA